MKAYIIENNKLVVTSDPNIIERIYFLEVTVPTQKNIKSIKNNKIESVKDNIKRVTELISNSNKIPLYDIINTNIHLIGKSDVYSKVVYDHYRHPDIEKIKKKQKELREVLASKSAEDVPLKERLYKKLTMMNDFLSYFDKEILYNTYIHAFYYSNPVGKNITQCVRNSFMPHYKHLKPFYEREEIIKMAYNMRLVDKNKMQDIIDDKQLMALCSKVKSNDISHEILMKHQKHIIENKSYGLIQYFTFHGSYFMNKYLRELDEHTYRDKVVETHIDLANKLIRSAPEFDKDYVLYRFIRDDSPINKLKIGDIFVSNSFVSTTRDPFYDPQTYKFGFILMKIKIPKNVKGVALSVETLSMFPSEQELIIAPQCRLKLVAKDTTVNYYTLDKYQSLIDTQYEFDFVGFTNDILYQPKELLEFKKVDFLNIERVSSNTVAEKINHFTNNYVNEINQFVSVIDNKEYVIIAEWYNSTSVYRDFYAAKTSNGFSLYNVYKGEVQFILEIGEAEKPYIYVNYYRKLSSIQEVVTDKLDINILTFIASVAYYFNISNVIIYADYISCDYEDKKKSYRGGSYCIDFYDYLKTGKKRFSFNTVKREHNAPNKKYSNPNREQNRIGEDLDIPYTRYSIKIAERDKFYSELNKDTRQRMYEGKVAEPTNRLRQIKEIKPVFSYFALDKLSEIKPSKVITKDNRDDMIYQIYKTIYGKDDSIKNFYIWLVENYCYLVQDLIEKMTTFYHCDNPFENDYYVFNAIEYLYNREMILEYPSSDSKIRSINKNRNRVSEDTRVQY